MLPGEGSLILRWSAAGIDMQADNSMYYVGLWESDASPAWSWFFRKDYTSEVGLFLTRLPASGEWNDLWSEQYTILIDHTLVLPSMSFDRTRCDSTNCFCRFLPSDVVAFESLCGPHAREERRRHCLGVHRWTTHHDASRPAADRHIWGR